MINKRRRLICDEPVRVVQNGTCGGQSLFVKIAYVFFRKWRLGGHADWKSWSVGVNAFPPGRDFEVFFDGSKGPILRPERVGVFGEVGVLKVAE
jgi:hypothetical protein